MIRRPADTRRWLDELAAEESVETGRDVTREEMAERYAREVREIQERERRS
jgi:hypothetical protein